MTPLYAAVYFNAVNVVKFLLQHGSLVPITSTNDESIISVAVSNGDLRMVTLLAESGALIEPQFDQLRYFFIAPF